MGQHGQLLRRRGAAAAGSRRRRGAPLQRPADRPPQDLHYHLRQAIAFLHGQTDVTLPINWEGLFWDIRNWDNDDYRPQVQEAWAIGFWAHKARTAANDELQTESTL
ncbi:MAG: type I-E CRISPR-associated protein Cse2/CasB [Chloroflexota bacterium]